MDSGNGSNHPTPPPLTPTVRIDRPDEALELANTLLVWDEIKNNLIRLYSSKKSEANLLSELSTFSDNQTLGQLFFGISKVRSQLFSILKNSEHNNTVIDAKKVVYNEVCLNAFITGLREPLKTFVRLKSPSTLKQAYKQCQIEQTLYRAQNNRSNRTEQRSNESDGRNLRNNNDNNNCNGRNDRSDHRGPYSNSNQNRSSNSGNLGTSRVV
ncbi:bromodomain-containing protein DDB_G0280777-like [Drosophila yakuba]|uniref:bromodomain-containing protein DDB_G0280777-like n=1 Tax=Drosophila yakuba TaxID=7245 RepID=UPI001C89BBCB|nr:bromodomain-containing protein DDB_G0280777-like [Drosophila yakuba]